MSTNVTVSPPPGREIGFNDFADITTAPCLGSANPSDSGFDLVFDGALTADQVRAIQNRVNAVNANAETIRNRAYTALANNRTYLALTTKTNADVVSHVDDLTRQVNGLIRAFLDLYDGTD